MITDILSVGLTEEARAPSAPDAKFWKRFGWAPDFSGQTVMDYGCGHGALCGDILKAGAAHVVGIDLDTSRIEHASLRYAREIDDGQASFESVDIGDTLHRLPQFDVIVSNATEYVARDMWWGSPWPQIRSDKSGCVTMIYLAKVLKPGGLMMLGFSPLYYSPFGDHGFVTKGGWPWLHLLKGKSAVVDAINRSTGNEYETLEEAGLSGLTPCGFVDLFSSYGCDIVWLNVNPGIAPQVMAALAMVPAIGPLFSVSIYMVLRKHD